MSCFPHTLLRTNVTLHVIGRKETTPVSYQTNEPMCTLTLTHYATASKKQLRSLSRREIFYLLKEITEVSPPGGFSSPTLRRPHLSSPEACRIFCLLTLVHLQTPRFSRRCSETVKNAAAPGLILKPITANVVCSLAHKRHPYPLRYCCVVGCLCRWFPHRSKFEVHPVEPTDNGKMCGLPSGKIPIQSSSHDDPTVKRERSTQLSTIKVAPQGIFTEEVVSLDLAGNFWPAGHLTREDLAPSCCDSPKDTNVSSAPGLRKDSAGRAVR